ncbi:hypothetical protein QZH41_008682, partial [Actinostola sp. cb2023]
SIDWRVDRLANKQENTGSSKYEETKVPISRYNITSSTRICSRHFIDEDYQPADNAGRLLLKRGAIPTKFAWSSKLKTRRKIIRHIDRYSYMYM